MAKLKTKINRKIAAALLKSAERHTSHLHKVASDAGWPKSIVSSITISVDADGYKVRYPRQVEQTILTLEYGDENTPPNPIIRNFLSRIGEFSA
jgi:hypothetical protein